MLGEDVALRSGLPPPELSPEALALLEAQPWRGNIRELRNVLEQAVMRSESVRVEAEVFSLVLSESGVQPLQAAPVRQESVPVPAGSPAPVRPLAEQIAALETQAIRDSMLALGGNKVAVDKALGISRATLYARLGLSEN